MVSNFSSNLKTIIYTPTYPLVKSDAHTAQSVTMRQKLLGDGGLREVLRDSEPELIFTDSAFYAFQVEMLLIRRAKRTPIFVHLHGDWWREYWSGFSLSSWRKRILGSQQFAYNWGGLALVTKALPVCRWLEAVTKHYLPRKRTEVVYMGIDPVGFRPLRGMHFDKPAVAIIQNHTVLPKVLGLLSFRKVTELLPKVHFYIAEGQPVAQAYLPTVKSTYEHSKNVHFVEGIDSPERVRMMLTSTDCYVLASRLDCCPTTVLEASLIQKPVIASRVGGVPEIVLQDRTGWTIPNDSTNQWVNRIVQLLEDTSLRQRLGAAGREWVSENFAWSKVSKQIERVIIDEVEA